MTTNETTKAFRVCGYCSKEYEIKLSEAYQYGGTVHSFSNCLHCGSRNDVWVRFMVDTPSKNEDATHMTETPETDEKMKNPDQTDPSQPDYYQEARDAIIDLIPFYDPNHKGDIVRGHVFRDVVGELRARHEFEVVKNRLKEEGRGGFPR